MPIVRGFALLDPRTAAGLGLHEREYAALYLEEDDGSRVFAVDEDIAYGTMIRDAPQGSLKGAQLSPDKFRLRRPGWPEDWHEDVFTKPTIDLWSLE